MLHCFFTLIFIFRYYRIGTEIIPIYLQSFAVRKSNRIKINLKLKKVMPANLITTEDLREFKMELLDELKNIINSANNYEGKKYLKSAEIRKLLKVSPGTLQTLRINGTLPYIKIGGIILYDLVEVNKILEANKVHNM